MVNFNLTLIWHRTYTSYWFIPFVMSLLGVCLLHLTVQYKLQLRDSFFARSLAWLNFTDLDVAHQLLGTIISSIINVISITFSLTMVVLTMAASQLGCCATSWETRPPSLSWALLSRPSSTAC